MYVAMLSARRLSMVPSLTRKAPEPIRRVTIWWYMLAGLAVFAFLFVAVRVYTEGNQVYFSNYGDHSTRGTTNPHHLADSEVSNHHTTLGLEIPAGFANYRNRNPNGRYNRSIILYAKQRTGSSFVSEIFNHHPDVFYVFEPLNAADWTENFYDKSSSNVLDDVFNCNIKQIINSANNEKRENWVRAEVFCHLEGQNSVACKFRNSSPQHWSSALTVDCRRRAYLATKLIMLPRLELLEPYIAEGAQVVVVVRDPRGVVTSRMKIQNIHSAAAAHNIALEYCLPMLSDLSYLRQVQRQHPKQTADIFWLLRYEDMARNTMKTAQQILEFLGLPTHSRVRRWALGVQTGSPVQEEKTYSTKRRNSTRTSQGWKTDPGVSQETILTIEDACRPLMRTLGYKFVNPYSTLYPLKVDTSRDYLGKFDKNTFFTSPDPLLP